jgi:hypothetical protein
MNNRINGQVVMQNEFTLYCKKLTKYNINFEKIELSPDVIVIDCSIQSNSNIVIFDVIDNLLLDESNNNENHIEFLLKYGYNNKSEYGFNGKITYYKSTFSKSNEYKMNFQLFIVKV